MSVPVLSDQVRVCSCLRVCRVTVGDDRCAPGTSVEHSAPADNIRERERERERVAAADADTVTDSATATVAASAAVPDAATDADPTEERDRQFRAAGRGFSPCDPPAVGRCGGPVDPRSQGDDDVHVCTAVFQTGSRITGLLGRWNAVASQRPSVARAAWSRGWCFASALCAPRPTLAWLRSEPSSLRDDGLTRSPAERGLKGCDHAARAPAACFRAGRVDRIGLPVECPVSQLCWARRGAGWSMRHNCAPGTSR